MYTLTEKSITLRGVSRIKVDETEVDVVAFEAVISSADPVNMTIASNAVDPEKYKENIGQCREDEDAFREYVHQIQDEMIRDSEA